jgi:hypothetical protein
MTSRCHRAARWIVLLAASMGGGTLFASCEMRLHDAVIDGTKFWLLNLFDPSNFQFE